MPESIQTLSPAEGLGLVLDEHLRWIGRWHRVAFFGRAGEEDLMSAPAAFAAWCAAARDSELAQQPAVEKLAVTHEQMHRQARLLLLKAESGGVPTEAEYESVIGRFEDFVSQIRRMERAFAAASSGLDLLTGLRHRRGMQEALDREMNRFNRTGQPFCIALSDIDKFKSVNDTHGHDAGDRVLAAFAGLISRGIRSFDEAFRMGGEEFLICLKEAHLEEAFGVIERLRLDVMNTPIPLPEGGTIAITASFGLVQAAPGVSIEAMIADADKALYQAKHTGRNRVVRWGVDRPDPAPAPAKAPRRTATKGD